MIGVSTTTPLRVGSLFSGIGGFDFGLERAGMKTEFFVECEPYCQRVLAKHWPDVPIFNDIREVGVDTLPAVDVLCGGFPCQDISVAGKGAGIHGARSGLWSEFARLVRELRPRYVLVENVPALRSRGLWVVLGELAESGYDSEWDGIPASAVGAHHQRDRIWIVAYPNGSHDQGDGRPDRALTQEHGTGDDGALGPVADANRDHGRQGWPWGSASSGPRQPESERTLQVADVADTLILAELEPDHASSTIARQGTREGTGWRGQRDRSGGWTSPWEVEPDVGRVADGVPARMDRLRALGNALVPQIAEWIGHRIVEYECSS